MVWEGLIEEGFSASGNGVHQPRASGSPAGAAAQDYSQLSGKYRPTISIRIFDSCRAACYLDNR
jgi:hypothetical protein